MRQVEICIGVQAGGGVRGTMVPSAMEIMGFSR